MARAIIVEDEFIVGQLIAEAIRRIHSDIVPEIAQSLEKLQQLDLQNIRLVIVDCYDQEMFRADKVLEYLLETMGEHVKRIPIILTSGKDEDDPNISRTLVWAKENKFGIHFLDKPFSLPKLARIFCED